MVINNLQSSIIESAQKVLNIEAEAITEISNRLDKSFEEAINILYNCRGRVVVTGMGKSGLIGRKISATFSSTGTPSFFLHPAEGSHGDSGAVMKNDTVVAISNSGETEEILYLLPLIKRLDIKLIAMTGKKDSTLAQKSNVTLDISVEKEACSIGFVPTASTTAALALGDALAVVLLQKRGFTPEDFLMFHPSGKLGKGLLWKVEDLMHTGDKIPIVNQEITFHKALCTITDKKLGLSLVVDNESKVTGIITDGDIRRALNRTPDTSKLLVKEVMTLNPKIIDRTALAASALQLMEQYSITAVIIVDKNGKPEGVLHIHDLLKAGVA